MTTTNSRTKEGFSLMELLVVMAILAILMAMVAPRAGNLIASSREHKCRNNLRQLQAAVMSHMNDQDGKLPKAMSHDTREPSETPNEEWDYSEQRGWIAWSPDENPSASTIDRLQGLWKGDRKHDPQEPSLFHDLGYGRLARFGIEHGTLFDYMNRSFEHYACPVIKAARKDASKGDVYRTYAMNPFFFGPLNRSERNRLVSRIGSVEQFGGRIPEASKLLLFVEVLPRNDDPYSFKNGGIGGAVQKKSADCCIAPEDADDFDDAPPYANLGVLKNANFLHKIPTGAAGDGPNDKVIIAMAVFFDGHIEKIVASGKNPVWAYNRGLDPAKDAP